jgi:hypothetical protein
MLTRVFRDFLIQEQEVGHQSSPMSFPPPIDFDPDTPPWCRWFLPDSTITEDSLVQAVGAPRPLVLRRLPKSGYHLAGFAEPWTHGQCC